MKKWLDIVDRFLLVVFILLYFSAKIHFFTRYGAVSLGAYLEEHVFFWGALVIVMVIANLASWLRAALGRSKPD